MRKWLAGWFGWIADRLYPHYSERMRRELRTARRARWVIYR
ncbi:hypothetical protein [Nocardia sp. CA-290969]